MVTVNHFDGIEEWRLCGNLHRDDDQPAVIRDTGQQEWWNNGQRHRSNGPAQTWPSGEYVWWFKGQLHRDGGPAQITLNANTGELESYMYFKHGKVHRNDGPAWYTIHMKMWYNNDKLHRDDGPAIITSDGCEEWWIEGVKYTQSGAALMRDDRRRIKSTEKRA